MSLQRPGMGLVRPSGGLTTGSGLIELGPGASEQGGLVPTDTSGLLVGAATYGNAGWTVEILGTGVATGAVGLSCHWTFDLAKLGYQLGLRSTQRLSILWAYTAAAPFTGLSTDRLYVGTGYLETGGQAAGSAVWAYSPTQAQMRAQDNATATLVNPSINLFTHPDRLVDLHTWNTPTDVGQSVGTSRGISGALSVSNSVITDVAAVTGTELAYLAFGVGSAAVVTGTFTGRLYASVSDRFGLS